MAIKDDTPVSFLVFMSLDIIKATFRISLYQLLLKAILTSTEVKLSRMSVFLPQYLPETSECVLIYLLIYHFLVSFHFFVN